MYGGGHANSNIQEAPVLKSSLILHFNPALLHKLPCCRNQQSVLLVDPEAADFVLGQGGNIKIVGLDVTHSCQFTGTDLRGLQGRGRFGTFLSQITAFYLKYHQ